MPHIATLQEGYESSSAIYVTGNPRLLQYCYTIGSDLAMNLACGRVCAVCLCALMQVLLLLDGRVFPVQRSTFGAHEHEGYVAIGRCVPGPGW